MSKESDEPTNRHILALSPELVTELQRIAMQSNPSLSRHARIILARNEGRMLSSIATVLDIDRATVRRWIKRFHKHGVGGLVHASTGKKRKRRFNDSVRESIARVALDAPVDVGETFTHWSLRRLRAHVMDRGIVADISVEGVRQLLRGLSLPIAYWRRSEPAICMFSNDVRRELELLAHQARPDISRRARVVLERSQGASESEVAISAGVSRSCVRRWLKRFEQRGTQGLAMGRRSSHPLIFTPDIRHAIIRHALMDPRELGFIRPRWSLRTLRTALVQQSVIQKISIQHLGRIIGEAGISFRGGLPVPVGEDAHD